jgi:hypothetical protein
MCTVTFIPEGEKIFFTSNRDERKHRSLALPPVIYNSPSGKILYPKDRDAGGTWAALHQNGTSIILLNGGFVNHIPHPPYRQSRGLILLELIASESSLNAFNQVPLFKIEPFTAVIFENGLLFECVWDGRKKSVSEKDASIPHIWSSVTLYEAEVIERRKQWFNNWLELQKDKAPSVNDILHFHQFTGDGDSHNDLLMNRNGHVFTVSITSIEINAVTGVMHYLDLQNKNQHQQVMPIGKTIPVH